MVANNGMVIFNPNNATEMAQCQGQMAGYQAGHPNVYGVATAPTSIYNQAGYIALQDTSTGTIQLKQVQPDSIYTNQWYDQNLGFNINCTGHSVAPSNIYVNPVTQTPDPYLAPIYTNGFGQNQPIPVSTNSQPALIYPYGYSAPHIINESPSQVDANGNPITLDADDIKEMVEAGIYDSNEEALNDILDQGYTVEDGEQGKLNIYTEDTEEQISLLMDKLGISREEALAQLGEKAVTNEEMNEQVEQEFNNMLEDGYSRFGAYKKLVEQGYDVNPDYLKTYNKWDLKQIEWYMDKYGCTKDEAAEALHIVPNNQELISALKNGKLTPEEFINDPGMISREFLGDWHLGVKTLDNWVDKDYSIFGRG